MPIGGKDAFLSKVTFRRESKWYSKTKQELKDMETIEERANLAAWQILEEIGLSRHSVERVAEIIAEKIHEQKAIDIENACKACENELRRLKRLLNESVGVPANLISVGKSLSEIRREMISST